MVGLSNDVNVYMGYGVLGYFGVLYIEDRDQMFDMGGLEVIVEVVFVELFLEEFFMQLVMGM